jgi:hypothetical protein
VTPKERSRLQNSVAHRQGDGATARVVRQKGGGYLIHVTNEDGSTVTVMRVGTSAEVVTQSEKNQWSPPWTP